MLQAFQEHCHQQQMVQTLTQAHQMSTQTPGVRSDSGNTVLSNPSPSPGLSAGCRSVDTGGSRELPSIDAYTFSLLRFASTHRSINPSLSHPRHSLLHHIPP